MFGTEVYSQNQGRRPLHAAQGLGQRQRQRDRQRETETDGDGGIRPSGPGIKDFCVSSYKSLAHTWTSFEKNTASNIKENSLIVNKNGKGLTINVLCSNARTSLGSRGQSPRVFPFVPG